MGRGLTFADAVRVLGGAEDQAAAALDRLTGGLLLSGSAIGFGFVGTLFDPAAQLVRFSSELVGRTRDRLDRLSRLDRTQRLEAAHAVVVLAAYFEVLAETSWPFDIRELNLSRADQVGLAAGGAPVGGSLADVGATLLCSDVPCPGPQWPYELSLAALSGFYQHLSVAVLRFLEGLAVWDGMAERARRATSESLRVGVPELATRRYDELFRQLAVTVPEFAFWANLIDQQATRHQVQRLSEGLADLGRALETMTTGRAPDDRRRALARSYQAALTRPILSSGEVPQGIRIPPLRDGYVNPAFRIGDASAGANLADEACWRQLPVRDDLPNFLAGHFTSSDAVRAPLLVLGQPGSGKSVLTRILAARLPPNDFLTVVVPLREVPAESDVQAQIEYSIRAATGEALTWPDLVRSAGDALPVVILDGFDELLQATGTSQSDYLERLVAFQQREAELNRPVAVMVTARSAVADRARSVSNMAAVRLEPFHEIHIQRWLTVWNTANGAALAARGLRPLPARTVLAHPQLAAQPLLLLMLALYDADTNQLQTGTGTLAASQLYEQLLNAFAAREVRKTDVAMSSEALRRTVERELTRLSIVALAMFNRNRQWTTQTELDNDLPGLLVDDRDALSTGRHEPLTPGQLAVGRFYFVYEAQAIRDGNRMSTFEFLHATFGEYLVARLASQEVLELASTAHRRTGRSRFTPPDDEFLHAILSWTALTSRATVVTFLRERLADVPSDERERLKQDLLTLFHQSMRPRHSRAYDRYEPTEPRPPARHAAWAANLVLLVILAGGEITVRELFPDSQDGVSWWRQLALLWRSQLHSEGWNGLVHTVDVLREWEGDRRVIRLRLADAETPSPPIDLNWSYSNRARQGDRRDGLTRWRHYGFDDLRRHSNFLCDRVDDTALHATEPFTGTLDAAIGTVHGFDDGATMTPAHALLRLVLADDDELTAAYDRCLTIALHGFLDMDSGDAPAARRYRDAVLHQLIGDRTRLPHQWLTSALDRIVTAGASNPALDQLILDIRPGHPQVVDPPGRP